MMVVAVFLRWPEKCFRADEGDLRYLGSLLPKGAKVIEAKSELAFLSALPEATHVITWHFREEWYALAPKLVLVATPAAGRELVAPPPPSFVIRNPTFAIHFGGFHGAIISETVLAFVLAYAHGFFARVPLWPRSLLAEHCLDVAGTKAVIAGYGRIGRAIGEKLAAFGVSVRGLTHAECDFLKGKKIHPSSLIPHPSSLIPHPSFLRSSLRSADWFILALPSDTGTDDFLDAELIAKLPKRCVVINIGRGNAIDERALLDALRRGRIAAAYLDVYKYEPTVLAEVRSRRGGSAKSYDLAALPDSRLPENLIRMPHGSSFSPGYMKLAFKELKDEKLI